MSFSSPHHDAKEQIRQAIDIVDLVGSYLPLRRQGSGYVGLCPWHDDSRPSLQVNSQRQSWKCWVCDVGGDIFSFVMQREGVDFREALTMLAERAGVPLVRSGPAARVEPGSPQDKGTLYQAAAWAEKQFHQCLLHDGQAQPAREYFQQRGITPASIERYHLGFAPQGWQWLLDRARTTAFSPDVLEAVGLVARSSHSARFYDRFRGRVLFPIRDAQNRPIAFGGRILPQWAEEAAAKYINSPETRLFTKSQQLYGLDVARDAISSSRQVVVMEGYTDVVMARQCGLENAVAVLGTSLGARHIELLRRFADTVILVLDGDEAGQRRTNEILELFVAAQVDLRILTLPEGLDPCDFLLQQGAGPFAQLLQGAVGAVDHKIQVATRGIDLAADVHRAHAALEEILATLAKVPRTQPEGARSSQLRQQQILGRLARQFHVPQSELRARLSQLRRPSKPQAAAPGQTAPQRPAAVIEQMDAAERELLEILPHHPELVPLALEGLAAEELSPGPGRQIFSTYLHLEQAGQTLDFAQVLTALEDPWLKAILVGLDERARAKHEHVQENAARRLQDLLQDFRRRTMEKERRGKLAALEARRLNEQEEQDFLLQLLEQERNRQGISAPTDGWRTLDR